MEPDDTNYPFAVIPESTTDERAEAFKNQLLEHLYKAQNVLVEANKFGFTAFTEFGQEELKVTLTKTW